ncbi:MAG: DNA repair protein RecO [Proteobacteria bacterium]|nr:DNA repair protein RecO [Pseudomonadota bacterium]
MSGFSTSGILIRRVDYGDYDYILTFLTHDRGKITVIAKNAKKSMKRFLGILELFSFLELTCSKKTSGGLAVLQEAYQEFPFEGIRKNMIKTAYASYWSEMVYIWLEEHVHQKGLFSLLMYALGALDAGEISPHPLSLLFQIRFMHIAGFAPHFESCSICQLDMGTFSQSKIRFDLEKGAIVCDKCATGIRHCLYLSKGTIKQLIWLQSGNFQMTERIRWSVAAISEGLNFLEAFVPFHIGRSPKSLGVLKQIREAY